MLDLGLEHLDVDISGVGSDSVGGVVRACGESEYYSLISRSYFFWSMCSCGITTWNTDGIFPTFFLVALSQLDVSSRCPAEKAAIIVAAHKVVVGMSAHYISSRNLVF
jgi:hypothetical protein